jgi:hypothetical protein
MRKIILLNIILSFFWFEETNAKSIYNLNDYLSNKSNYFIENKGQWPNEVLYLTKMNGLDVWITNVGLQYTFYKLVDSANVESDLRTDFRKRKFGDSNSEIVGQRIFVNYNNSNSKQNAQGLFKQSGYFNYLVGDDDKKHAQNVGLYKEVIVKNVYDGIDVRYYFEGGNLRYDFIVNSGHDYKQIQLEIDGSIGTEIKNQDLVFKTIFGEVKQSELFVYQNANNHQNEITSKWKFSKDGYSFEIDNYDVTKPLIIDPLIYSTFIGGNSFDQARGIDVDNAGNAYITGFTVSLNYATTPGVFQQTNTGGFQDVFITKLNSDGTNLIFSTLLGGSSVDVSNSIVVDNLGNSFVSGSTMSTNFDITSGSFQTSNRGGNDIFVTKLNSTGTALIYSCILGGDYEDEGYDIAIDNIGNAFITGYTESINYHVTSGAFQNSNDGTNDVFVTKLNSNGTSIVYSTLIGGSDYEGAYAIDLDGTGNAYITGYTESLDFDVTLGSYQTNHDGGGYDVFVTKLNSTGTALVYSTYFGGSDYDESYSIAIGEFDNAYITGYTNSIDFNTTTGAYETIPDGMGEAFISKFNFSGTDLVFSTLLGGSGEEYGYGIAVDNYENAILTGWTTSTDFDITTDAYQSSIDGSGYDLFVTKINSTGNDLEYSTYLGGTSGEYVYEIAIDTQNNAYVTGETLSQDFDHTIGAYQTTIGSSSLSDNFVSKICLGLPMDITLSSALNSDNQNICEANPILDIVYDCSNATGAIVTNIPPGLSAIFSNSQVNISGTPTSSGVYDYLVTLYGGCDSASANGTITINKCTGIQETFIEPSFQLFPNPNNGNFTIEFSQNGYYTIEIINSIGQRVFENKTNLPVFNIDATLCDGIYILKVFEVDRDVSAFKKLVVQSN